MVATRSQKNLEGAKQCLREAAASTDSVEIQQEQEEAIELLNSSIAAAQLADRNDDQAAGDEEPASKRLCARNVLEEVNSIKDRHERYLQNLATASESVIVDSTRSEYERYSRSLMIVICLFLLTAF